MIILTPQLLSNMRACFLVVSNIFIKHFTFEKIALINNVVSPRVDKNKCGPRSEKDDNPWPTVSGNWSSYKNLRSCYTVM